MIKTTEEMRARLEVVEGQLAVARRLITLAKVTRSAQRAWWNTRYKTAKTKAEEMEKALDLCLEEWFFEEDRKEGASRKNLED